MSISPASVRTKIAHAIYRSSSGYRLQLRRQGYQQPTERPSTKKWNAVLQSTAEWKCAVGQIQRLGLPLHPDGPKNWDSLIALDAILQHTTPAASVLDAGAELYSRLLAHLFLYGYRNLHGINLSFNGSFKKGPIRYSHGDITKTAFGSESFDVIACLSVIEHGVDPKAYFKEVSRILKPGGLLITSTDYWEDGVDTAGLTAYGVPIKVFTASEMDEMLSLTKCQGFQLTGPLDLKCGDKCVTWKELGLQYTFVIFTLRKT